LRAFLFLIIFTVFSWANTYVNADDISFVDDVIINGIEYTELPRNVEFDIQDLKDGKIKIQGLLESLDKSVDVNSLHVEITTDGGETWTRASGNDEWDWSFTPELEKPYDFSFRVVRDISRSSGASSNFKDSIVKTLKLISPQDAQAVASLDDNIIFSWTYPDTALYKLIITDANGHNKHKYSSRRKQISQNLIDMIRTNGNSVKWHIEAYNHENSLLAQSIQRTLYLPDLSTQASIVYKQGAITKSKNIKQGLIDIFTSKEAVLNGLIKNSTSNDMSVDVSLDNDSLSNPKNLFSTQLIVPANYNKVFSFNIFSSLNKGNNHLKLTVKKSLQSTTGTGGIQNSFTVAKSDKNSYKIGDFTLVTDATAVDGKITGTGTIKASILNKFDKCNGTLTINFQNLSVEADKITDTITYEAPQGMEIDKTKVKISANNIVFAPTEAYIDGNIIVKKIGNIVAPVSIDVPHITLKADSFQVETDIDWRGEDGSGAQKVPLWFGSYDLSLMLKQVHISVDTTRDWYKIVELSNLKGGIKFGNIFDGTKTTIQLDTDGAISWTLSGETPINSNKTISFKDCSGKIDVLGDSKTMTIGGTIRAYITKGTNESAEHIDLAFLDDGLTINSTGLHGSVALDTSGASKTAQMGNIPVSLKTFSVEFDGGISGGSLAISVDYDNFFKSGKEFKFDVLAAVSEEGLTNFKISGNPAEASLVIDGFATITLDNFSFVNSATEGAHFITDMSIYVPSGNTIEGDVAFEFKTLKLSSDGIEISEAGVWKDLDQRGSVTASLYGVEVYITSVGFGIENGKLFVGFAGGGGIGGDVVSVDDMKVALYSDGTIKLLENPMVTVDSSVVEFKGALVTTNSATVKGFKASGDLQVKNLGNGVHVTAEFMCGSFLDANAESKAHYWRIYGSASTGSGIPLTPIPLSIYGFGGGVGYNVEAKVHKGSTVTFEPKNNKNLVISIATIFGTTDSGYTLHGPAILSFSTGGQITFNSTMYITSGLMQTPKDRKIDIAVQLTTSPFRLYATGTAHVTKKASQIYNILEVNGNVDLLFSSTNSHLHIGTKEAPVSANFLEVLENNGYLMLDKDIMSFGYEISFKKSASCCLMYGSIDVGAKIDTTLGIRPFYVDAQGKLWAIVTAGVKYHSFKYEVFAAGAKIEARFRAPNPTYGKLDVSLYYSILGGLKSGTYEMTYWINKPSNTEEDTSVTVGNLELFQYVLPMNNEKEVSRLPKIEISTTLPIGKSISIDSLLDVATGVEYKFFIPKIRQWSQNNIIKAQNANESILLYDLNATNPNAVIDNIFTGGKVGDGGRKLIFHTNRVLIPGDTYKILFAGALKDMSTGEIIGSEGYSQKFTVTKDVAVDFRSIIEEVHPHMGAVGVYRQTDLYLRVRGMYDAGIKVKLYDPLDREVGNPWRFKQNTLDNSQASQIYAYVAKNHPDLKPVVVYVCDQTGEQREAQFFQGKEVNPFIGIKDHQNSIHDTKLDVHAKSPSSSSETQSSDTKSNSIIQAKPAVSKQTYKSTTPMITNLNIYQNHKPKLKQTYTYTRKVLKTYTIKAQKDKDGVMTNLYTSTFDVVDPPFTVTTDKAGNQSTSYPDYADEIEMLQATMKDAKFKIVRAPVDYDKKQEEWDQYISNTYQPSIDDCHNYNYENAVKMGYLTASSEYLSSVEQCEAPINQRRDTYKESLDQKYAKGGLSYLLFEFRYRGFIDPKNISLSMTPTCRITGDNGVTYSINNDLHAFKNLDSLGSASGENGYQVLRAKNDTMQVQLNLNLYPTLRDKLSRLVSQKSDFNNISCGFVSIHPRNISVSGYNSNVGAQNQTSNGVISVYKNNIPLTE
jgi:hypothetical protein